MKRVSRAVSEPEKQSMFTMTSRCRLGDPDNLVPQRRVKQDKRTRCGGGATAVQAALRWHDPPTSLWPYYLVPLRAISGQSDFRERAALLVDHANAVRERVASRQRTTSWQPQNHLDIVPKIHPHIASRSLPRVRTNTSWRALSIFESATGEECHLCTAVEGPWARNAWRGVA